MEKKEGGRGLLSISQRPVYNLPFVLIFGVLSEGGKKLLKLVQG